MHVAVSARAILAYFQVAPSNHEDLEAVTVSVSHRRLQRMPSNGGEFSGWLDRSARGSVCENVVFRIKRSALEAAHAHLHDVRRRHEIPLERTTRLARSRSPIILALLLVAK